MNQVSFTSYLQHLDKLEGQWRPMEMEYARRIVYGDPLAMELSSKVELYERLEKEFADGDEESAYVEYLQRHLNDEAQVLARLPDYEKISIDGTVITQKTCRFGKELKSVMEITENVPFRTDISSLLVGTAQNYLDSFEEHFRHQLGQLPHLAALFYNDCHYISKILGSWQIDGCVRMETAGSRILQAILDRNTRDVAELCNPRVWERLYYGQLDEQAIRMIEKSLSQGYLQVGQVAKVFKPILAPELFSKIATEMVQQVLDWVWNGILNVKSISRETLSILPEFVQSVRSGASKVIESDDEFEVDQKLEIVLRISQQNLIQVSNAFRRDEYRDTLSLIEFRAIIGLLFPETAMKAAFLAEIDAEIN
jgi:hypothetical protein